MRYRPTFEEFAELARSHTMMTVYRQLIGDTLTPVSAFCKVQEGEWSFLFESVVGGERMGRYSFLGAGPFLRFQAWGNRVHLSTTAPRFHEEATSGPAHDDPLKLLEEWLSKY